MWEVELFSILGEEGPVHLVDNAWRVFFFQSSHFFAFQKIKWFTSHPLPRMLLELPKVSSGTLLQALSLYINWHSVCWVVKTGGRLTRQLVAVSYDLLFQRCCPQSQLWTLKFYLVSCTQWGLLIILYFKVCVFVFFFFFVGSTSCWTGNTQDKATQHFSHENLEIFVLFCDCSFM